MSAITFATVCTGIGAPEVAWEFLGWQPLWMAEIEAAPSAVLAHRWPSVPNMGDMTKLPEYMRMGLLPAPDVLCGGTPCQAYSLAGLRQGLDDPRGQLTLKYVELADAIDSRRPAGDECVVVWENVPGVLSDGTNAFGHFLAGLAGEDVPLVVPGGKWPNAGAVVGPARAIAWRIVDAQYFGVAQRRRRVLLVASARDGFDPAAVLFEFDGLRRDSAPRREAGQETAAGTLRSSDGGCDVDHARAGHLQPVAFGGNRTSGSIDVATALNACGTASGRLDFETETFLVDRAPLAFSCKDCGVDASLDLAPTMRAMGPDGSHANAGGQLAIAEPIVPCYTIGLGSDPIHAHDLAQPITCRNGDPGVVAYGFQPRIGRNGRGDMGDLCNALTAQAGETGKGDAAPCVAYRHAEPRPIWRVRKLTPRECERLQGFPDDHTLVPHRGKPMADGPRYKTLGNSMCVFKMRWLGQRIDAAFR